MLLCWAPTPSVWSDQDFMAPGTVLTSMVKRVDLAVYEVIKAAAEGTRGRHLEPRY